MTTYGDISPRTAALAIKPLLVRGHEEMILERFGQTYVLPTNSTQTAKFRRYELLALATTPLNEGVTPSATTPTSTDYSVSLLQHGAFMEFTDVIQDTHEDPVLQTFGELLMQQWSETIETLRWGILKAGTNVVYANGTQRTDVNTPITLTVQRKATKALLSQRAKLLKEQVSSNANFNKESIAAAFIAVCHTHCENDIRNMQGFIPTEKYAATALPNEIGSVENVRYVRSVLFTSFADAGGAKGAMTSTSATSADVYPVLYIAKDCYGMVPLKGKTAMSLIVHNPGSAGSADPLNQRGTIGWSTMQNSVILNDLWLVRAEVAVTA